MTGKWVTGCALRTGGQERRQPARVPQAVCVNTLCIWNLSWIDAFIKENRVELLENKLNKSHDAQ